MTARPLPVLSERDIARFWSKVDRSGGPDACWPWRGAVDIHGYGSFGITRRYQLKAHRVAFFLATGRDPVGFNVNHRCDNPICVNPAHLEAATQGDNVRDSFARGRSNPGPGLRAAWKTSYHPKGEQHGMSRLTSRQAAEIRSLRSAGVAAVQIACEFGICVAHVYRIARGDNWKNLGGAA